MVKTCSALHTLLQGTHHDTWNDRHKTHHPVVVFSSGELRLDILLQDVRRIYSDQLALWDAQVLQAAVERLLRVPAERGYLVEIILRPISINGLWEAFALEGDTANGVQVVLLRVTDGGVSPPFRVGVA